MRYDAIVVGGGMAGLTAAAYLAKAGRSVLLCEKGNTCGGLVNTFERDGFFFDGGIRAVENSGMLFPMLKQLELEIEFVRNRISIGIEDQVIRFNTEEDVQVYGDLLKQFYPESRDEIDRILMEVKKIMGYMEVLYGIDNPAFLDIKKDRDYFLRTILPWMVKYALTAPKISRLQTPVVDYLKRHTRNQSLLDIICQHFFQETPAFFALSYLKLYLEYQYPPGGTGKIVEKLAAFIEKHGGKISTDTEIVAVDSDQQVVTDAGGGTHAYRKLVWAADQKAFYRSIDSNKIAELKVKNAVADRRSLIAEKTGNDSIFTLFLALDVDKDYFASKASEHFFYTPVRTGLTAAGPVPRDGNRQTIEAWLEKFFSLTTYEISCPVLRDSAMAPQGKTGLIVSSLFDYRLTKHIEETGWYEEFKTFCEERIIHALESSIYPGMRNAILQRFSSTPVTIAKMNGSTEGAIVGWAFYNEPLPAESRLSKILNAIRTPIPGIFQAGQWTYSPSGLPISILTGKLAADQVIKELKKGRQAD